MRDIYSNSVETFFLTETESSSFEEAARNFVESFEDKDIMDVWVLDTAGHVIVSSSGFPVADQPMPDFDEAKRSQGGTANYRGRNLYREPISACTHMLKQGDEPIGAVRYVVSMKETNRQVRNLLLALLTALIAIGLIMLVSGITFVDSIVTPIMKINEVTKRIAGGDMSARVELQEYEDEISELSENINFMAEELNSTDKMKNDFISTVSHEMKTPLTAIKGWAEKSDLTADQFFSYLEDLGVRTVICTDIARDGVMQGTNLSMYRELFAAYSMDLIASGGVSSLEDVSSSSGSSSVVVTVWKFFSK